MTDHLERRAGPHVVVRHNGQTEGRFWYAIVHDLLLNIVLTRSQESGGRQYGRGAQQQRGAWSRGLVSSYAPYRCYPDLSHSRNWCKQLHVANMIGCTTRITREKTILADPDRAVA